MISCNCAHYKQHAVTLKYLGRIKASPLCTALLNSLINYHFILILFLFIILEIDAASLAFVFFIPLLSTATQMVVADLSEPDKRADALSKLGLCFGVGMIAGSTLGGHLNTRYG